MSINESDAKVEAQSAWRAEGRSPECSDQFHSEGGTLRPGGEHGDFSERTAGAVGTGATIGGIIARMIADKHERIREVEDCLDWYEREKVKRLAELADLEKLAAQSRSESNQ